MNAISAMLADVVRNARVPYAASLLLAPAIAALTTPDPAVAFGEDTGAVPDPPTPKWPPAIVGMMMFAPLGTVDVGHLARPDRLSGAPIGRHLAVVRVISRTSLVLAIRAQSTELLQLKRRTTTKRR